MFQLKGGPPIVAGLLLIVAAAHAAAPVATFLTPSQYTAAVGDAFTVRFDAGSARDAQPAAWPIEGLPRLFVRTRAAQENRHDVRPERSGDHAVRIAAQPAGLTMIGADLGAKLITTTSAELQVFLDQHVASLTTARPTPGTELRIRHVAASKTFVRVTETPDASARPSAIALSKSGQVAEIQPLVDPTATQPGGDVPLRVFVNGDKKPAAKVQITHVPSGATQTILTDAVGSGFFRLTDAGLWRIEFHHAEPLEHDPAADWIVYTATLTFEAGKGAGQ